MPKVTPATPHSGNPTSSMKAWTTVESIARNSAKARSALEIHLAGLPLRRYLRSRSPKYAMATKPVATTAAEIGVTR